MSAAIAVACDDPEVERWASAWIRETRLLPPAPLALVLRVVPDLPAGDTRRGCGSAGPDTRVPFLQPQLEIRSGPPQGDVRVRWLAAPARAVIAQGAGTACVDLTPAALADRDALGRVFLTMVLILLLRRAGWHHVHAALARDPRGREWLFAGDAQTGKSTTAALLATRGWAVGTDDAAFLARGPFGAGVEAVAQRAPIALRPAGCDLLGLVGGTEARGGRKTAFFPEELGGTWTSRVRPQVLVFPRVGGTREGEATTASPMAPREALAELVRWSAWVMLEPELAQEHLDMLAALAQQASSWRVALAPDLFRRPDLLMELVP